MRIAACLALAAAIAGCAGVEPRTLRLDPSKGRDEQVFFPGAPEVPRYFYAGQLLGDGNYADANGAPRSKMRQVLGWIAGLDGEAAPEGLQRPQSGLSEPGGRILVTDGSRGAVMVFDPVGGLETWEQAAGLTRFSMPVGIAESPEGRIFVADAELGFVAELDSRGKPVAVIGKGILHRPTGVAYDPATHRLFVADTPEHDIKVFDAQRRLVSTLGRRGEGEGEFNYPTHLAFARGDLYVADTMNSRIQVFAAGERHRLTVGTRGVYLGNMVRPKGIAVDGEGNIYVVESYYDHLLVYDRQGRFLLPIGGLGKEVGQFYLPSGVWTDARNRVFVADMFNGRIVVLQFMGGGAESEQ
ncbi:MAG: 6-bladed beta-propeller [Betaproteobacteria bacterium]